MYHNINNLNMEIKTTQTTETPMDDDRVLATGLYCIKVQANHDC
jgi:hypothetical protein